MRCVGRFLYYSLRLSIRDGFHWNAYVSIERLPYGRYRDSYEGCMDKKVSESIGERVTQLPAQLGVHLFIMTFRQLPIGDSSFVE